MLPLKYPGLPLQTNHWNWSPLFPTTNQPQLGVIARIMTGIIILMVVMMVEIMKMVIMTKMEMHGMLEKMNSTVGHNVKESYHTNYETMNFIA